MKITVVQNTSSYISFGLVQGSPGQHSSGVSLQEDYSLSLALPLLSGQVTPAVGLEDDGRPAHHEVLCVKLARPNKSLQPGKAMLDLEIGRTNVGQSFFCLFFYTSQPCQG